MSNGKGDTPRPLSITDSEYVMRWEATFTKQAEQFARAMLAEVLERPVAQTDSMTHSSDHERGEEAPRDAG